jgi:NAD(P)H dehydrogenase (quinone)
MTIAVTGATGHLGALAIDELLKTQSADSIVAIVRNRAKADGLAARGVEVRVASYTDPGALDAALTGVDSLLLVSSSEVGRRFEQHRNVVDAAQRAGVSHLVYTSAPKATTTELILAPEHKATEEYIAQSGIPATILRNNWYTENYASGIDTATETGEIVAAAGEGRVASASRVDYAAAAAAVLTGEGHIGKTYELSGDYAWSHDELAAAISAIIGKPVVYRPVDAATRAGILEAHGVDAGTAGFVAALDGNTATGLLSETSGELSRLIGRPTTPLLDGLKASRDH